MEWHCFTALVYILQLCHLFKTASGDTVEVLRERSWHSTSSATWRKRAVSTPPTPNEANFGDTIPILVDVSIGLYSVRARGY